jgi:hypothetical protein
VHSVCLKHAFQMFFHAAADDRSDLLVTQQPDAIEHVPTLKAEIDLIHHLFSLDGEDGDRG